MKRGILSLEDLYKSAHNMYGLSSGAVFPKDILGVSDTRVYMDFKAALQHGGEDFVRDIGERDRAIVGKGADIFLMVLNKHDDLGEKPRIWYRACGVALIIVFKEIQFQNEWRVFVGFARDVIRTWGFAGLKFAESVVQVLHGKRGIDGSQYTMGSRDWNRILGREPNLVGEVICKSFGSLGGIDQFTLGIKETSGAA